MTKKDTLQERKERILTERLPKTFQDVVSIARFLEVKYVWIDSLCIIQDDESDWQREASKMAEVYANSYLIVAASSSPDSSGGCFPSWSIRSRYTHISSETRSLGVHAVPTPAPILETRNGDSNPMLLSRMPFAFVSTIHDNAQSTIYVHSEWLPSSTEYSKNSIDIGTFDLVFDPVATEPLSTRGWTLQECFLSPRILHCGTEQVFWQCYAGFSAEEGSKFINKFTNLNTVIRGQRLPVTERGVDTFFDGNWTSHPAALVTPSGRWDGGWLTVVEEYSRRKLTYGKDKLPAPAGLARLARFVAGATNDEYYAGVWRGHILKDLYWGVATSRSDSEQQASDTVGFPEGYRAPSWSWASLDTEVSFIPGVDLKHPVAKIICGHTTPRGIDPYGELTSGYIELWVSARAWERGNPL